MEINITKDTHRIKARNKKTGEVLSVNLLHVGQRRFNNPDESWGTWYSYSKRDDWEIFIEIDEKTIPDSEKNCG